MSLRYSFVLLCVLLAACTTTPKSIHVTKAEYGNDWPLTVGEGDIECREVESVVFRSGGVVYALNGTARGRLKELPAIDAIWAFDDEYGGRKSGLRKNMGDLISRGLALCHGH